MSRILKASTLADSVAPTPLAATMTQSPLSNAAKGSVFQDAPGWGLETIDSEGIPTLAGQPPQ
jgi:hypothetical protein